MPQANSSGFRLQPTLERGGAKLKRRNSLVTETVKQNKIWTAVGHLHPAIYGGFHSKRGPTSNCHAKWRLSASGLGSNGNGTGISDFDVLIGDPSSATHTVDMSGGSFTTVINPPTFIQAFTGFGSEGTYQFNFSQLLTVNGQTLTLNGIGSITIGTLQDSISILSSEPLLFQFDTFTVSASVLPVTISGVENGAYCGFLSVRFEVTPNCETEPVPEPATLLLLGTGLTGIAAKIRKRRKAKAEV